MIDFLASIAIKSVPLRVYFHIRFSKLIRGDDLPGSENSPTYKNCGVLHMGVPIRKSIFNMTYR